ncbi:DUF1385 domain-containing protein [Clostridium psychrophilum]|uniref:DUF1385 domain-containing protein n=1 Tax=Clostridium psychrophilum TaxID=132926 RepID=UPI001C0C4B13|nr:DUF1385 domain-containing protein [Clostridium psychrophilum]MBU3179874.1 DUF1385 domain-containing protein [Clostridium psychrophilum]
MSKNINVGGQAVIEGVMMRGSNGIATAVRTEQGEIVVEKNIYTSYTKKNKIFGLPIIRGFISLIESLIIGVKTLNYSASFFEDEDEDEPSKFDKWIRKIFKEKSNDVIMGVSLVMSLAISIGIFFILPTIVANFFSGIGATPMGMNIVEGIIRVVLFLLYVYLIGKMEDIKRVYEYHGAEHKTIFCYESGTELTPENAAKFGRLHPRCGTNFLFLVMIVSIIMFSFTGWHSIGERIMYRIVLLPLISGVSYEIIKWMGKSESIFAKILSYPGLKLQNLTTREPDLSQLEVAIRALKVAEGITD